jgi:hypothetical protein
MDNMESKKARVYLDRWRAQLNQKDRTIKSVQGNFGELWFELWKGGISYDTVLNLMDDAVKAHLPNHSIAK